MTLLGHGNLLKECPYCNNETNLIYEDDLYLLKCQLCNFEMIETTDAGAPTPIEIHGNSTRASWDNEIEDPHDVIEKITYLLASDLPEPVFKLELIDNILENYFVNDE